MSSPHRFCLSLISQGRYHRYPCVRQQRRGTAPLSRRTQTSHLQTLDENGFKHVIIIAGCCAPSSRESKRLCSDAKEAGAGYVLVLTPSVWPPQMTRDAILAFHRDVRTETLLAHPSLSLFLGRHSFTSPVSHLPHRHSRSRPRFRHHPRALRPSNIVGTKLSWQTPPSYLCHAFLRIRHPRRCIRGPPSRSCGVWGCGVCSSRVEWGWALARRQWRRHGHVDGVVVVP